MKRNVRSLVATAALSSVAVVGLATQAKAYDTFMLSGTSETLEVYLYEGQALQGYCGEYCYDLDLTLMDEYGNVVSQDVATDAVPIVGAPYEGVFYLQIDMVSCDNPDGCFASVN